MDRGIIREQIEYYRAQAPDYRHVVTSSGPFAVAREKLLHLGRQPHVLELAPGAGDWTQELVRIGGVVTVVDASAEMMEINRQRVGDARVEYRQADLFEWAPEQEYDLVFFAFWLSHVPPDLADTFLAKVCSAVRPGGHLFIIETCDEYDGVPGFSFVGREGIFEERRLPDGRTFKVVKVFYHPRLLAERVKRLGFEASAERVETIFYLSAKRLAPSQK